MSPRIYVLVALVITAILLFTMQIVGEVVHYARTDIAVADGRGKSLPLMEYRINRHQIDWVHGWPWCYLTRHTTFLIEFPNGRPNPAHNPMDERSWAVHRGVTWFNGGILVADIAVCFIIALVMSLIIYGYFRKQPVPAPPTQ